MEHLARIAVVTLSVVSACGLALTQRIRSQSTAWHQWGGAETDFAFPAAQDQNLLGWPTTSDPQILWRKDLGAGYSAIVSDGDTLYVPYRKDDREHVAALNSDTGAQIWERSWEVTFPKDMDRSFGSGPNSTPVYFKKRVIAASTDGRLVCVSAKSGGTIWEQDIYRTFGHANARKSMATPEIS